jgi:hypothetical protein
MHILRTVEASLQSPPVPAAVPTRPGGPFECQLYARLRSRILIPLTERSGSFPSAAAQRCK